MGAAARAVEAAVAGSRAPAWAFFIGAAAITAYLVVGRVEGGLQSGGLMLGAVLFVAPLIAAGVFFWGKASSERSLLDRVLLQKSLLGMVETRGQIHIDEACEGLRISRDDLLAMLYDLVGKGLFSGYIDWKAKTLYSKAAKDFPEGKCPSCGGEYSFSGKGVVKCEYCGSEVFLSVRKK